MSDIDTQVYGVQRSTQACLFAIQKHNGQMRKYYADRPYAMHVIRVAERVRARFGVDENANNAVCAAFLHDTIEDCGVMRDEIQELFGANVAALVWELTNPSKGSKRPRDERKAMDRVHIAKISDTAKFIKLVDRIDNINEIENAEDDFKYLYAQESLLLLCVLRGTDEFMENVLEKTCLSILDKQKDKK